MSAKKKPAKRAATQRKTTAKTTAVVGKIPQSHGGALNAGGTPGNKGGTGRPPDEFRQYCRDLISDPACEAEVRAILTDRKHPAYSAMWKGVTEQGYGKAPQSLTLTGPNNGPVQYEDVTDARDEITSRIARIAQRTGSPNGAGRN